MDLHTEIPLNNGGSESNPHTGMYLHTEIPLNNGGSGSNPHTGINLHTEIPLIGGMIYTGENHSCNQNHLCNKLNFRMIPCLQPVIDIL